MKGITDNTLKIEWKCGVICEKMVSNKLRHQK